MSLLFDTLRALLRPAAILWLSASAAVAVAQQLPSYYPDSFQRAGRVDAVVAEQQRIVINDVPYRLADNVIVHSLNAYSVPQSRLRAGLTIAFRTAGERRIAEIWLLPDGYDPRRRGR